MSYKIKITETVGSASIVTEVETDDLSFVKFCVNNNNNNEDAHEVNVNIDYQKNTEELLKQLGEDLMRPEFKTHGWGGIEYWKNQPTALGSDGILVAVTNG